MRFYDAKWKPLITPFCMSKRQKIQFIIVFICIISKVYLKHVLQPFSINVYSSNPADSTIANWINKYEDGKGVKRLLHKEQCFKKHSLERREWLIALYKKKPTTFLSEAKDQFLRRFEVSISQNHIWTILHEANLSWKTLERRAIQICMADIDRYASELLNLQWLPQMLVFLDEVSFDNRHMLRTKGYGISGEALRYRGEFNRKPRVSLLEFIGVGGIIGSYDTEGTFDRLKFLEYCSDFALNSGEVRNL